MAVIYHYRVTKYDPALRDGTGAIFRDDWTAISDIGKTFAGVRLTLPTYLEVEAHHLVALASFMEESDTSRVRAEGVENSFGTFRVSEGAELSRSRRSRSSVRCFGREAGVASGTMIASTSRSAGTTTSTSEPTRAASDRWQWRRREGCSSTTWTPTRGSTTTDPHWRAELGRAQARADRVSLLLPPLLLERRAARRRKAGAPRPLRPVHWGRR